jgi:hypothetical protein
MLDSLHDKRNVFIDIAILSRVAELDVGSLRANGSDPILHHIGHELEAVVRTDMVANA